MPDKTVFIVDGDGSMQMNSQEIMTAVAYKIPIKVVILNNQFLGMVRQWQELFWGHRYSSVNMEAQPDFVKLAEAYGAIGMRIEKRSEVVDALRKSLEYTDVPVIMDFRVVREENVFPMIPGGQGVDQMMINGSK